MFPLENQCSIDHNYSSRIYGEEGGDFLLRMQNAGHVPSCHEYLRKGVSG